MECSRGEFYFRLRTMTDADFGLRFDMSNADTSLGQQESRQNALRWCCESTTVKRGRDGAKAGDLVNVRRRGAGSRTLVEVHPELYKRCTDPIWIRAATSGTMPGCADITQMSNGRT